MLVRCAECSVPWKVNDRVGVRHPGLSGVWRDRYAQGDDWTCMLVQQGLAADPLDGAVFAFRGRRAGLIKLIWHDGIGLCMLTKRQEPGQFVWPSTTSIGGIALSAPQLASASSGPPAGIGEVR